MIAGGRGCKMPCESCGVQFSVFKRKRVCCECERYYCSGCLRRGGGAMCAPCRVLSTRPLYRNTIAHLKVRDLQCFLQRQNVSTRGCVEKEELVNLCVLHVNGAAYRRRGARSSGAFSSLKGLTNNINDFLNSAFDLRGAAADPPDTPAPPTTQTRSNCFNTAHAHRPPAPPSSTSADSGPTSQSRPYSERFTTTPGGERGIYVPPPPPPPSAAGAGAGAGLSRAASCESARIETADCFEIEDLDDSGWEFVSRPPADPLPNDSDVLISVTESTALRRDSNLHRQPPVETRQQAETRQPADLNQLAEMRQPADLYQPAESRHSTGSRHSTHSDFERIPESQPRTSRPTISREYLTPGLSGSQLSPGPLGARAASELELRDNPDGTDTGSLKDELVDHDADSNPSTPRHVTLEQMKSPADLEALNVKQLKELLTRNRVEFRGCLERTDLLERAKMLYRDHAHYRDEIDNLPIEECCKICMAAPLECVLLECGHIAACTACSKQLAECPICRQYVVRAVRFFRS